MASYSGARPVRTISMVNPIQSIQADTLKKVHTNIVAYGYLQSADFIRFFQSSEAFVDALTALEDYMGNRYDSGFGGQMVYGIIVFDNQSWLERREYDGSEWWQKCSFPTVSKVKHMAGVDDAPKAYSADRLFTN